MLLQPELFTRGYCLKHFDFEPELKRWIENEDWKRVDEYFLGITQPGQWFFSEIQKFHSFERIETMLSIRDSINEFEDDGIWHDDGSRVFAISLSLTLDSAGIRGGDLELRSKHGETFESIATPPFSTAICFLTGVHGYEHRTRKVTLGKRIILVAWCS